MTDDGFRNYLGFFLFERDGDDDHLYRACNANVHLAAINAIGLRFFPPFSPTDFRISVGGTEREVIRIRKMPFQIRIQETVKSQALLMVQFLVDLAIECHAHGLTPSDSHEGNLLWWDRPYFVDFDALHPLTHQTAALTFVRIGYLLYRYVFDRPLPRHDMIDFASLEKEGGWMAEQVGQKDFTDPEIWDDLRRVVGGLSVAPATPTHWSAEYAAGDDPTDNEKFHNVMNLAPPARTLLDVGCNKGYTCNLLFERYESAMGFDPDPACIEQATTQPGLNFACFGIEHLAQQQPVPIKTRFHADVVLALAVTHHFDFAGFSVPFISEILAGLTKKYLIIEDIAHIKEYCDCLSALGLVHKTSLPSQPATRSLSLWWRP